jgi:hypothetical protein
MRLIEAQNSESGWLKKKQFEFSIEKSLLVTKKQIDYCCSNKHKRKVNKKNDNSKAHFV